MTVDLKIERHIGRTPETCFDLWTRGDDLAKWWGPKDDTGRPFRADVEAWSAVPGDSWAIALTAPDGRQFFQRGRMLEVVRPRLLRFTFAWIEGGESGPETEIRVTFMPEDNGTRLIFEQIGFAATATRDGHIQGWEECLNRLATQCMDRAEAGQ